LIRVLTPIAIALFFIGYPPFHRSRSPEVVLVLKHLIYRVLSVQPSISSDALSVIAMKLRFRHVRRTPQRAWIGSIRIELQHLVVKLSRRRHHLGDAFEIADVLTGFFDDSGAVVLLGFLMSGDHRAWFQFLDCVECRDPLLAGPRV